MTTGRTTRTNGRNSKSLTQPTQPHKGKPAKAKPAKSTNGSARREMRLPLYTESKTAAKPKEASCTSCGLCCSYVAIEVDTPKTVKQATQLLWYVYHQGVSLYVNDDEWMVQFDTTCIHLQPD